MQKQKAQKAGNNHLPTDSSLASGVNIKVNQIMITHFNILTFKKVNVIKAKRKEWKRNYCTSRKDKLNNAVNKEYTS